MKYALFIVLALSFAACACLTVGTVNGQAVPSKVHAVGVCNPQTIKNTVHLFALEKQAPSFELFLFCQADDWRTFLQHFNMETNTVAFTDWTHGRVYLGPKNLDAPIDLRETIEHELKHLRCACTLGER